MVKEYCLARKCDHRAAQQHSPEVGNKIKSHSIVFLLLLRKDSLSPCWLVTTLFLGFDGDSCSHVLLVTWGQWLSSFSLENPRDIRLQKNVTA